MRLFHLILLWGLVALSLAASAQTNNPQNMNKFDYEAAWQQVNTHLGKNLPESALKVIEQIYQQAKTDNNADQLAKALVHRMQVRASKEEFSFEKNLVELRAEISQATFPLKPLLHSMMAELYWQYYTKNRWRFSNRSTVANFQQDDLATWSLQKIVSEVAAHHEAALQEADKLQKISVDFYKEMIVGGNPLGKALRPTLYDFLSHRALALYMNQEPELVKPDEQFTISEVAYLGTVDDFLKLRIQSPDTLSFKLKALQLWQDLLRFHSGRGDEEIFTELDLQRLAFVLNYHTDPEKEERYLGTLEKLLGQRKQIPVYSQIQYQIAQIWANRGARYQALQGEAHRWDIKKAISLCDDAVQRYPESRGAQAAKVLKQNLQHKDIGLKTHAEQVPGAAIKVYMSYKNLSKVHWRVVKTTPEEINEQRNKWNKNYEVDREKKFLEYFLKRPIAKSGQVQVLDDGDYQSHAVEFPIEALPEGYYLLMASHQENFALETNTIEYTIATVSNIAYIHRNLPDGTTELFLRHRQTGRPLPNAQVQVHFWEYNYQKGDYVSRKGNAYTTNAEGYLLLPFQADKNKDARSFSLDFTWGKDRNSTEKPDNNYYRSGTMYQGVWGEGIYSEAERHIKIFTDRAIYRPNQPLYFKGVIYRKDAKGNAEKVIAGERVEVVFYDRNSQEVARQSLTTSEYGTFQGVFSTPSSGLMGKMYLSAGNETVYFSVEEYKRPKFEVRFEPVQGSPRLGSQATVTLQAQAYSGANIDGAEVKYRVVRKARFPAWWFYRRGYYPDSPAKEIAQGTARTDAAGKLLISFEAQADKTVNPESDPIFDFEVQATVTDINGESHSQNTILSIGYKALVLGANVPAQIDKSRSDLAKARYQVVSNNLMGNFEPAQVKLTLYPLQAAPKAYRKRLWERPDRFVISKKSHDALFPEEEYADEGNFYQWQRKKAVWTEKVNTATQKDFAWEKIVRWESGLYLLEMEATDAYGQPVKENVYVTLYNSQDTQLPYPSKHWTVAQKTTAEPEEKAQILFGASLQVPVLYEIEHDGKIISSQWVEMNREQRLFEIPIKEEYRGNIVAYFTYIQGNELIQKVQLIQVPYTDKELDIRFATFRDKLQPGAQDEWTLTIKDKKGAKIAAEMVATLYDASLDAFAPHQWSWYLYRGLYATRSWSSLNEFQVQSFISRRSSWNESFYYFSEPYYDGLQWFGYSIYEHEQVLYRKKEMALSASPNEEMKMAESTEDMPAQSLSSSLQGKVSKDEADDREEAQEGETVKKPEPAVQVRKNFNETAFFLPELRTNAEGEIVVRFTMPESLTRWRMMGMAHTKEMQYAFIENQLVTQKELMVVPNQPRFFRENDRMHFSVKISSLAEKALTGEATLEFFDALNMKPLNATMLLGQRAQAFSMAAGQSTALSWEIQIPEGLQAITYRVIAKADNFSDGEEMMIPVLTNRMLVTESLPLPIRGKEQKNFRFEKLLQSASSSTLRHQSLTLEFTSNPAWYAVQALPYLMEYPFECVEQTFSRFYANSIASQVANSHPRIKQVFDTWRNIQPDALLSNLEKNQELKSALLEETPWVLQSQSESARKRNIGLLFDLNRMANEEERALEKILEAQASSGGFMWFKGLPEDRYMTQHIIAGMGHLGVMGVQKVKEDSRIRQMNAQAINYLDAQIVKDHEWLKAQAKKGHLKMEDRHIGYLQIHYLYTRSYFTELPLAKSTQEAMNYYLSQARKYWTLESMYMQGLLALALHRYKDAQTPVSIIKSLDERALHSEEMGMYWKSESGYWWYQAPIERQALMIELYEEVARNEKAVEALKVWLLKQKQTQDWKTTRATAEACYALLRRGTNLLVSDEVVEVRLGNTLIDPTQRPDIQLEAGTGYYKTAWTAAEVKSEMGNISVHKKDQGVAWGAVYWQYFEQLDKITPAETPLKLSKKLFRHKNTPQGPIIEPLSQEVVLQVGDLVKVRIELRVDRDMEYVHLKDMRAAAFEPVSTLSTHKYQDGLYYYESPRDMATHFFIGWLAKGTYVFEYDLRVSQKGNFSNGITSIQCMYAPEFGSHSEGIRVEIK